ncbi:NUDIX hydrolase [Capillimicrobium parvum]|uniref:NADH pyrophosphatase n=1 Tax=Capillimicrobium parvum TaxID=2884022 RepID=A0A9E6Y017_9ACTN|nr:NUDIX domain-containing protein [Capillimicrobium parvum]UGS37629.1 NADH pyrophosphatase [Capillimicrobium parvum]
MPEFRFCPLCAAALRPVPAGPDSGRPSCPEGHFVHYENPAVTAFAFVRDEGGRYLTLRRAREPYAGSWDLPGGFVEPGETPADAIRREVREETGLDVGPERILGAFASQYGDDGRWTVDIGFECAVTGGRWRLDPESTDAAWHAVDELPRLAFAGERAGLLALRAGGARRGVKDRV